MTPQRPSRIDALLFVAGRLLNLVRPRVNDNGMHTDAARFQEVFEPLVRLETENRDHLKATVEALGRVGKEVSRSGKEQFRANTLAAAQQQKIQSLLDLAEKARAIYERELGELHSRVAGARDDARLQLMQHLLPVLDGLEEAMASAERLLVYSPGAAAFSFGRRLKLALDVLRGTGTGSLAPGDLATKRAWLEGLAMIRQRLLDVLAAEAVHPLEVVGQRFDPHLHVAVDAIPARHGVQPGTILSCTRRGYRAGEAVLRYAEVIVAR